MIPNKPVIGSKLHEVTKRLLKNSEFARQWAIPDASEIMILRRIRGISQKKLAKMADTKQEAISRLENNPENWTPIFIGKLAYALGYRAKLVFEKL